MAGVYLKHRVQMEKSLQVKAEMLIERMHHLNPQSKLLHCKQKSHYRANYIQRKKKIINIKVGIDNGKSS